MLDLKEQKLKLIDYLENKSLLNFNDFKQFSIYKSCDSIKITATLNKGSIIISQFKDNIELENSFIFNHNTNDFSTLDYKSKLINLNMKESDIICLVKKEFDKLNKILEKHQINFNLLGDSMFIICPNSSHIYNKGKRIYIKDL